MAERQRLGARARRGSGGPAVVRVWLLDGFRVRVGSRPVGADAWRLRKAKSLLKLLALARGHTLHREQVMDVLWPDLDAEAAANNLHRALHFARRALEPVATTATRYLRLRDDHLELCPDSDLWVDVEAFEEATATARRAREPAAYRAAIELYAGDLLPEDPYEEWTHENRAKLRESYLTLLNRLARLHEDRAEYEPAIEVLERMVAEEPTDEGARADLMRLYALRGRRREALVQYERLREALGAGLDMEPGPAVRRLYEGIRAGEPPTAPSPHAARHPGTFAGASPGNLPAPLTSFVGRERELLEVKRALSMTRLLTLAGAGGTGKTRFALEIARDMVGVYPDGVWLAELAPLSEPTLVARAVAAALGVRERPGRSLTDTLAEHLRTGEMLLVLDNCEHLSDAAARLAKDLLSACPRLRVLATSREPLGVFGETVWPVPPLSLPEAQGASILEHLMASEAVRLFVDRARSRLPAFELTPENARAVAAICRDLAGIPLAVELATARMGALAVEQVAERLEDSLRLLTGGDRTGPPRHRTLRATLDWSYEPLPESERRLFERLSVFAGGWTLEAAEAVGPGDGIEEEDVLDLLSRLVNKSMVVVEADGCSPEGPRYGMLEPVRRYGRERLEASGEADAVRRRHASWFFELAREVEPWLRGARQEAWLERLEREYGNLRAALGWALESGDADLGLWFGAALGESWYMSGHLSEGRRWLEAALAKGGHASPARIRALARAGWIAWEQGDYARSVALSEESLALSRKLADSAGVAAALSNLAWAALLEKDLERASTLAEEAVTLGRALEDVGGVARALLVPGLAAVARGDGERAIRLHEESLALAREAEDDVAAALSGVMGVFACLGRGDGRRARTLCEEGLARPPRPRVMNVTAFGLSASAAVAGFDGRAARSARLWGAAESLREAIGAVLSPVERHVYGPYVEAARATLDEAAWEEARAEGRAMTVEEAEAYALADGRGPRRTRPRPHAAPKGPPVRPDAVLTGRQREVAFLVSRGLTNRQIASELLISEHTAANHVVAIIKRLGLTSRAQIAAWATEQRLRASGE